MHVGNVPVLASLDSLLRFTVREALIYVPCCQSARMSFAVCLADSVASRCERLSYLSYKSYSHCQDGWSRERLIMMAQEAYKQVGLPERLPALQSPEPPVQACHAATRRALQHLRLPLPSIEQNPHNPSPRHPVRVTRNGVSEGRCAGPRPPVNPEVHMGGTQVKERSMADTRGLPVIR